MEHFYELSAAVEQWGRDRGIVENSTAQAQLLKTMSELGELADATIKRDRDGVIDGVGDVLVTLILYSAIQGVTLTACLAAAYEEIKNRRGFLNADGVFVKE